MCSGLCALYHPCGWAATTERQRWLDGKKMLSLTALSSDMKAVCWLVSDVHSPVTFFLPFFCTPPSVSCPAPFLPFPPSKHTHQTHIKNSWLSWSVVQATPLLLRVPFSVAVRVRRATPTSGTCGPQ